jgi:hypothetical protein
MVYVLLSHKIKEYAHWKPYFDKDEPKRLQAGIKIAKLFRSLEDPNNIHVLMTVNSMEKFNNFLRSPDLKNILEESGVVSEPELKIMQEIT